LSVGGYTRDWDTFQTFVKSKRRTLLDADATTCAAFSSLFAIRWTGVSGRKLSALRHF